MTRSFYKTNDPAVMAASAANHAEKLELQKLGKEFAKHFGGILLTENGVHGYRIGGLCFEPRKDARLWTQPDPRAANSQNPRASIARATPDEKAELKQLRADWNALFPTQVVSFNSVLEAIGTDWGNVMFGGFSMFDHDGYAYVATSVRLADCMVEILGSEYDAARKAFDAAKQSEAKP